MRRFEYEDIPRGRIVLDIKKEKFIVYGLKLIEDNQFKKAIIAGSRYQNRLSSSRINYEDPSDLQISLQSLFKGKS